jgi:hypothetical protein
MLEPADRAFTAVRRLSQYRPFEGGGASAREAIDDLVLACLAEADGGSASLPECVDIAKTLFTIELHDAEVARSAGDLIDGERVERDARRFRLTRSERERLDQIAKESAQVSDQAVKDWRAFLIDRWPGLTDEQITQLEGDLRLFLQQVLYRQGAEAAVLLYPDEPEAQKLYEDLEDMGLDFLPAGDAATREIRPAALSHFIRRPTDAQKIWLGQQLNTTYFWRILSIDPEGAQLVREVARGQRAYLDTNLIYRLLGVQGPRFVRPAETIVRTTQGVGYECCVTPWTVREFRASLKRAADFLKLYPLPPSEYAELLAEATSDDDFVTAYWRHVRDGSLRIEDFVAHFDEVETNLERFGVKVVSDGCTAVEQRTTEIEDEVALLENVLHGRFRHPEPLAHDVQHRLLVRHLRGASDRRFANAGFWFLTFDSVMPRYDVHARRKEGSTLPFCVSAGAWFQIIEALRPKSEDSFQLLADLLASPYVRYRRELSKETAQAIVARVQLHKGGDPRLAARIMMNSALAEEIDAAQGEEQIEKIDNAVVAAAQQAQEDARKAQQEAERARERASHQSAKAREEMREAELRHAAELRDREERIEAARREQAALGAKQLEEERTHYSTEVQAADQRARAAETATARQTRRLRTLAALVVVFIASLAGLLALGVNGFWAVVVVVATVLGLWTAIDHLWIRRT